MQRKNIFIAAAFVFAIGSAFTTRPSHQPLLLNNGYIKASCQTPVIFCDNQPGTTCLFGTAQAYSDQGTCIVALKRSL